MIDHTDKTVAAALKQYDMQLATFHDFKNSCERLVEELLRLENIPVHSVTARVKDRVKLAEKLQRSGKNYAFLADVTDVIGVRVITHFEDEVDRIGSLVEREFDVNQEKSVDKRKVLDPDRFGYLSLHYICGLSADRLRLAENRRFKDLVCEVQIRSILQHAWAEIEHDLGYKSGHGIPVPIRRRFSRLAGLLEVADQEFAAIRDDLKDYEARVKSEVRNSPEVVGIDKVSLNAAFSQNPFIRSLDEQIARNVRRVLDDQNEGLLGILTRGLAYLEIGTVEQLIDSMKKYSELIIFETSKGLMNSRDTLPRGISALHLFWVRIGLREGQKGLLRVLDELAIGTPEVNGRFVDELMTYIKEFQQLPQGNPFN